MPDDSASNLADNVKRLREARGVSQQQIAKLAKLPNPTLAVLQKAAAALQVSIEELIGPPRTACQLFPAAATRTRRRGNALTRPLIPESIPGLDISRIELPPGGRMNGTPHTAGTREYLTCEAGHLELAASGEVWKLAPGDMLVFRGDQRHTYRNPGRRTAVGISVVAFAPVTG